MESMKDSNVKWIGEIPKHWNMIKCKYIMSFINGYAFSSKELQFDLDIPVVRISDITNDGINYSNCLYTKEMKTLERYAIKKNDILIAMSGSIGKMCINNSMIKTYINQRVSIIRSKYNEFVYYCLNLPTFLEYLNNRFLATAQPNISNKDIEEYIIPFPSYDEQMRIVKFLNFKCFEIDSLILDIQTQIETLEQYKKSVITEAVTKGPDTNVEMKNSGIDWIGAIPAHWNTVRISNIYTESIATGYENLPILTVSIKNGVSDRELSEEESLRAFIRSEDRSKYKHVIPGDLAYNMMRAWQGALGAVRVEGMISPAYVVARPKVELDSRYMEYLIRTPSGIEEMHRYSYGVADFRLRLYWSQFKNIKVCIPPYEEQIAIADYLDSKCTEISSIIDSKNEQIEILETYKKSLIYEYVTGKKEVAYA